MKRALRPRTALPALVNYLSIRIGCGDRVKKSVLYCGNLGWGTVSTAATIAIHATGKRNRAAREQALIAAATTLFASRGFESTTTKQIAAAAGCAEGLIHRYFNGKAGLLAAVLQSRTSHEHTNNETPRSDRHLRDEIRYLVESEVERMWADREFLRVVIPRAILDSSFGEFLCATSRLQRPRVLSDRLSKCPGAEHLSQKEIEALAHLVEMAGFIFGFMRPVVLGQNRHVARETALAIAAILARCV